MYRLAGMWMVLFLTGCALHGVRPDASRPPNALEEGAKGVPPTAPTGATPVSASPETRADLPPGHQDSAAAPTDASATVSRTVTTAAAAPTDASAEQTAAAGDEDSEEAAGPVEEEAEPHDAPSPADEGNRYTSDLSDEVLAELWKTAPEKLGSISIGFTDEGRMVNSVQFPRGDEWIVVTPGRAWATQETIEDVLRAVRTVRAQYPDSPPLRINQISAKDGGYLRPHKSHQSGRDVDLAFYYPTVQPVRAREREKVIDVKRTWALLRAIITETDVQKVLLDRHVQKVLYDYALASGDDQQWLDSIFHAGRNSIVVHARHHRDHMHVRFYNPRAQELGRRVAPLLALRPDQNLAFHRVRSGDTLGAIARRYGSTVVALRHANHLKGSMLHLSQVLRVPLRRPCTRCPVPPALVLPPRRLPPQPMIAQNAAPTVELARATASPAPAPANLKVASIADRPRVPTTKPAVSATSPGGPQATSAAVQAGANRSATSAVPGTGPSAPAEGPSSALHL